MELSTSNQKTAKQPQIIVEAPQTGDRVYGLDAARAVLMIAGIPYHAALPFSDAKWLIELQPSPLLGWLSWAIHLLRMPAFFFISGILSALVVSRNGKSSWIRNRNTRLWFPLLFGIFVVNYIQYIFLNTNRDHEYAHVTYSTFPGHFWFIIVLLALSYLYYFTYSIVNAALSPITKSLGPMSARTYVAGIFLVSAFSSVINLIDRFTIIAMTAARLGLMPLLYGFSIGFPYFLAGLVLVHLQGLSQLRFGRPMVLIYILIATIISYYLAYIYNNNNYALELIESLISTSSVALAIFIFCQYMNRNSNIINKLVSASFCIYIVHHPIIILLYRFFYHSYVSSFLLFIFVSLTSFVFSCAIWLFAKDVPVLKYLIGAR